MVGGGGIRWNEAPTAVLVCTVEQMPQTAASQSPVSISVQLQVFSHSCLNAGCQKTHPPAALHTGVVGSGRSPLCVSAHIHMPISLAPEGVLSWSGASHVWVDAHGKENVAGMDFAWHAPRGQNVWGVSPWGW